MPNAHPAVVAVTNLLDEIHEHRWLNLYVPHGFELVEVRAEPFDDPFESGPHWSRVYVTLSMPVVYNAGWSLERGLRAQLPAQRDIPDKLRQWVEAAAREGPGHFVELVDWSLSPDEDPEPGNRRTAPPRWTVVAVLDVM